MKHIIVISLLMVSISGFAQKKQLEFLKDLSVEERATLELKKMTLDLNLDEVQQEHIYQMNLKRIEERRSKAEELKQKRENGELKVLSSDEKYNLLIERLDKQIAYKNEMRSILNEDQFSQWERSRKRHKLKRNKRKSRSKRG